MTANARFKVLVLDISSSETVSDDKIEEDTIQLSSELRELNLESVERERTASVDQRTKAGEALTLGGIVVVLVPELIKEVTKLIFNWIRRNPTRTITIREREGKQLYEVTGAWQAEQLAEVMGALSKEVSQKQS